MLITITGQRSDTTSAVAKALVEWLEAANAEWRWRDATSVVIDNPHSLDRVVGVAELFALQERVVHLERLVRELEGEE